MIDCDNCIHNLVCNREQHLKERCIFFEEPRPHGKWTKESEPLECAKMLQEYCSKIDGCYPCMFRDKHGECRINTPIDWELEEVGEAE